MKAPPLGICIPCEWHRNRDGDTVEVKLRTGQIAAVRLIDCWCAEKHTANGRLATKFLDAYFGGNSSRGRMRLWVDLADPRADGIVDLTDILKALTFDRVPGYLFVGDSNVSEVMVESGHATRSKS